MPRHKVQIRFAAAGFYAVVLFFCKLTLGQTCAALIASGDTAYSRFDNITALGHYQRAHLECPDLYDALWKYTRALNDIGEEERGKTAERYFVRAIGAADVMIADYPGARDSYFLKAAAAGNLARFRGSTAKVRLAREVEQNASRALSIDSTFAPAMVILGAYYREVATASRLQKALARAFLGGLPDGTLEDSEQMLRRAIESDPENLYAHLELAHTYRAMGRETPAQRYAGRVLFLPITDHYSAELKRQARAFLEK